MNYNLQQGAQGISGFLGNLAPMLGSLAPLLGMGTGALGLAGLSGLLGRGTSAGEVLGGSPEQTMQVPRFNQPQQDAFSQILQQALSGKGLGQGMDFEPIAQQARTQFQQQTVPGLAERFTQMGGSGTRLASSGFGQALGSAGAGLEQGLASQKAQYGMDQQKMLMSLLGLGLTPQFDSMYQQRQPGVLEGGAQGLLSALPLLGLLGK